MAGAGYKLFATNDVLTAGDLNTYLQEQSVMVFATTAARDSALTSVLAEGMVCYVEDNGSSVAEFQVYDGAAWRVVWAEGGPSDHDFLPLSGGTLTGDLTVDGQFIAKGNGGPESPRFQIGEAAGLGMYGSAGSQWLRFATDDVWRLQVSASGVLVQGDLEVDGQIKSTGHWAGGLISNTATANREFMIIGEAASGGQIQIYGNNDSNRPGKVSITGDLLVNGIGVSRFNVADGIDTQDVLERAEVATMPAPDDEGVATTDADVDSITVNEVVTALLAKVKELAARIETLEGQCCLREVCDG